MYRDIVVIGASAGGVEACEAILSCLPPDLRASVFVTIHTTPSGSGLLSGVLGRRCPLPVNEVRGRVDTVHGRVYVAPPNLHLILKRGRAESRFLPKENGSRPAIDPMFRTAAHVYARRVIGVLLTGNLDDGVAGLGIIKDEGGIAVVQDPRDAKFPDMPLTAMQTVDVDHVVPLADIVPLLAKLVSTEIKEEPLMERDETQEGNQVLSCPGCGGVLRQYKDEKVTWYQCQVGHRFTLESMVKDQDQVIENELWGAIALLKQKQQVAETMAADARSSVRSAVDPDFFDKQVEAVKKAQELIQKVLDEHGPIMFPGELPKSTERAMPENAKRGEQSRPRREGRGGDSGRASKG